MVNTEARAMIDHLSNDTFDRLAYRKMNEANRLQLEHKLFSLIASGEFRGENMLYITAKKKLGVEGRFKAIEFVNKRFVKKTYGDLKTKGSGITLTANGTQYWDIVKEALKVLYGAEAQ